MRNNKIIKVKSYFTIFSYWFISIYLSIYLYIYIYIIPYMFHSWFVLHSFGPITTINIMYIANAVIGNRQCLFLVYIRCWRTHNVVT